MNVQTAIDIGLRCGLIPAAAALAVFLAVGWLWAPDVARRYRAGIAFAFGVFIGFVLLPETKTLAPAQFWEWLPHLGVLAAFVAGVTRAAGVTRGERWTAVYLFSAVAAWLIVPQWQELMPPWPVQWVCLAVGMIVLTALLMPLPQRLPGRAFPWWLVLTAATTSVLMMEQVSETFGRLAALPAGALAGCGIATLLSKELVDWRSLVLPFATVVGGYAFTGYVYPTTPVRPMLLLPLAPLALWMCTLEPLARLAGVRAVAFQAICVLTPLLIVAALLFARGGAVGVDW